ncbi:MAG: DUF2007 domain-containing protein [Actinobacteria bacterium]|nr:DUF2007 domain-containing protein [Actinomycetota bacterium]
MKSRPAPVVVATASDGVDGSMVAAALESAGIPVEVRPVGAVWPYSGAQGGFGPVQILVPASAADDAWAIVAELRRHA